MMNAVPLSLANKLLDSAEQLGPDQRDALKTVLCLAAQNLSPTGELPEDEDQRASLQAVIACLARLEGHGRTLPPNGVAYRGRPPFLTDDLLRALQEESCSIRDTRPIDLGDHWLGAGGPVADELARSAEMVSFVEEHCGPINITEVASYLFYDGPKHGMKAHVDTGIFSINANIMLEHSATAERCSYHFIYPSEGQSERIVLAPGEMVLSWAGSVVHGRAPLALGERVRNLTIGFQPRPVPKAEPSA